MFPTQRATGWAALTVLGLCLPVWSAVKVIQPYKVTSISGTARVHCFMRPRPSFQQTRPSNQENHPYPYSEPEEVRVRLLRGLHGAEEICSSTLNLTEQNETAVETEGRHCSVQLRGGAIEVTVHELKATDTDLYRCEIQVFYPPPYLRLTGNGTLIHVLDDSKCPAQEVHGDAAARQDDGDEEEEEEEEERAAPVSVPVVTLATLVMLVLLIIIYLQAVQCAQQQKEARRAVPGGPHKVVAVTFPYEKFA